MVIQAITYAKAGMNLRGISLDEFGGTNPIDSGAVLPLEILGRKIRNVVCDNAFGSAL